MFIYLYNFIEALKTQKGAVLNNWVSITKYNKKTEHNKNSDIQMTVRYHYIIFD